MADFIITLFKNCEILTMNPKNPEAEAMAMFQGKILAVGSLKEVKDEIKRFIKDFNSSEDSISVFEEDLNGKCMVPGFIDAHLHPGFYIYKKTQLDLANVRSYSELGQLLQAEVKRRGMREVIAGFDLIEDLFDNPEERRFPNKEDLDRFCPENPCFVMRHDGHICAVNSASLQLLNLNASNVKERTPESGEIRVDLKGNPTGIFTEEATGIALELVPIPENEQLMEACKETTAELASFGITTCGAIVQAGDIGVEGKAGALVIPLLESFIRAGLIKQDYVFYITTDRPKVLKRYKKLFHKLSESENRFVVGGIKIYGDGSFGASTAYMFEPFSDSTVKAQGFMLYNREELLKWFKETYELGFHIACHAIGDKTNRIIVDLYQELINENHLAAKYCRIEHASILTQDTIEDAAKLGIIMVCQPAFINSEYKWLERRLGAERIKRTYPFRSIIDAGVLLAGASDAPIESASVMEAIQVCVTRKAFVPEQAITVPEALRMFTYNAAYALGQENIKGSLEEGKLADFVILAQNPNTVSNTNLENIKILATYHRGTLIYSV